MFPAVTLLPIPPSPEDTGRFRARADEFWGRLPGMVAEINALAGAIAAHVAGAVSAGGSGITAASTSRLTVGTGPRTLTINPGKGLVPGQYGVIWSEAAQAGMLGRVTQYDQVTGALTVDVGDLLGTGTYEAWAVFVVPLVAAQTEGAVGQFPDAPVSPRAVARCLRDALGRWRSSAVYNLFAPDGLPAGTGFVRASAAWRMGAAGLVLTAAVNEPRTGGQGLLVEGPAVRLNQVAAAPAAPEDVTLPAGTFTVSFYGAGSLALSGAHEATVQGVGASPARAAYTFTLATAGVVTLTPTGAVLHLQLEAGQAATSPILGEGAAVVRAADVATHDLAQLDWLPETGTLYIAGRAAAGIGDAPQVAVCLDDGTADNRVVVSRRTDRRLACAVTRAGGTVELALGEVADGEDFRAMMSWTGAELVAVLEAAAEARAELAGAPVGLATLRIGRDAAGHEFFGHLRHVAVFPASGAVTL